MLLPLDNLREYAGLNPWHFWQLANDKVPNTADCPTLLREYAWATADSSSREDIRKAISKAEAKLTDWLSYSPGVKYNQNTLDVGFLRSISGNAVYYGGRGIGWAWNFSGRGVALAQLPVGKLSKIATLTWTAISEQAINLTDNDKDGIFDTFEAQIVDSSTSLDYFGLYFTAADRPVQLGSKPLADWEIRPVSFTRSGNTVTVTGPAWLVVKPIKYQGSYGYPGNSYNAQGVDSSGALDPDNTNNYVTNVAFYKKVYTSDSIAFLDLNCCGTITTVEICATIADRDTGLVQFSFDGCSVNPCNCSSAPQVQSIRFNYEAGDALSRWETTIARLALAESSKRLCGCEGANKVWDEWQEDLAEVVDDKGRGTRISNNNLDNPLGTKKGQVYAWREVEYKRLLRAINVTSI